MRPFFDTSVLVPVCLENHEHHEASLEAFVSTGRKQGFCGAHSLAELYSTLTRLPAKHRLSGEQVLLFLGDVRDHLRIVTLDGNDYAAALEEAAALAIFGGAIYDALLARCAIKAKADVIYTWNVKHFQQFGTEVSKRVRTP